MGRILSIESSGPSCSVAFTDGETLLMKEENIPYSHAEKLALFVHDLLKGLAAPDAVAVSSGPGSYTGLRIGVSLAKGLCFGYEIPLIAVPTLEALAAGYQLKHPDNTRNICPMIDARRMEVYTAVYSSGLQELLPVKAEILEENSFRDFLGEGLIICGDGAAKCRELYAKFDSVKIEDDFFPSSEYIALLAKRKFAAGDFEDLAYFEPFYLKDFIVTQAKNKLL